eukprot:snap_masked-scaffold_69-processed-gene-0.29-mRNA-1 protein AED:0.94 eAED:1.00 QI:0/-1/0/1/-1/1/1/0/101
MKDLKYFIIRSEVLQLYRNFLKNSRTLEKTNTSLGKSIKLQVQMEFRANSHIDSRIIVSNLLRDGKAKLKQVEALNRQPVYDERDILKPGTVFPWQNKRTF